MKTLIEKSIKIYGIGHPETKTIFNIENEEDKNDIRFKSLNKISGRKLIINFAYSENDVEIQDKVPVSIPFGLDENEVKEFILEEINKTLN